MSMQCVSNLQYVYFNGDLGRCIWDKALSKASGTDIWEEYMGEASADTSGEMHLEATMYEEHLGECLRGAICEKASGTTKHP